MRIGNKKFLFKILFKRMSFSFVKFCLKNIDKKVDTISRGTDIFEINILNKIASLVVKFKLSAVGKMINEKKIFGIFEIIFKLFPPKNLTD